MASDLLSKGEIAAQVGNCFHDGTLEGVTYDSKPLGHPPHQSFCFGVPPFPTELQQKKDQLPVEDYLLTDGSLGDVHGKGQDEIILPPIPIPLQHSQNSLFDFVAVS